MADTAPTNREIERLLRFKCCGRDAQVADTRVKQAVYDRLYEEDLRDGHTLLTGSKYEGMPWEVCGDVDFMICYRRFPIVTESPQNPIVGTTVGFDYVMAEPNLNQPAYLKLRKTECRVKVWSDCLQATTEGFLRSDLFVMNATNRKKGASQLPIVTSSGPAATSQTFDGHPQYGTQDLVPCLKSPSWPIAAADFWHRSRKYGWPSMRVLANLRQQGCYIVAKSHIRSKDRDIEWRWSFSVAERVLLDSMSHDMMCCIYALKVIKNHFLEENGGQELKPAFCSYYVKTACMWVYETRDVGGMGIVELCMVVLQYLIDAYKSENLQHYFIPEQNLLSHLSASSLSAVHGSLLLAKANFSQCLIMNVCLEDVIECHGIAFPEILIPSDEPNIFLKMLADSLEPRGSVYKLQEQQWIGFWSNGYYRVMYDVLEKAISSGSPKEEVVQIPERILLPVIDAMDTIIWPMSSFAETYKRTLHRYMGELLLSLTMHYNHKGREAWDDKDKILNYYSAGTQIQPGGWSDEGLTGDVLRVKMYFLQDDLTEVLKLSKSLWAKLERFKTCPSDLNRLATINIITNHFLSTFPWQSIRGCYEGVIKTGNCIFHHINPVALGYYMIGASKLKIGESCESEIDSMQFCMGITMSTRQKDTTGRLISDLINKSQVIQTDI